MAKGDQKSNREVRKPKSTAVKVKGKPEGAVAQILTAGKAAKPTKK